MNRYQFCCHKKVIHRYLFLSFCYGIAEILHQQENVNPSISVRTLGLRLATVDYMIVVHDTTYIMDGIILQYHSIIIFIGMWNLNAN
jgi:hypothetical protein